MNDLKIKIYYDDPPLDIIEKFKELLNDYGLKLEIKPKEDTIELKIGDIIL